MSKHIFYQGVSENKEIDGFSTSNRQIQSKNDF